MAGMQQTPQQHLNGKEEIDNFVFSISTSFSWGERRGKTFQTCFSAPGLKHLLQQLAQQFKCSHVPGISPPEPPPPCTPPGVR